MVAHWARPGVKCVCIKTAKWPYPGIAFPVVGKVYTIRAAPMVTGGPDKGELCLLLEEIRNPTLPGEFKERGMPVRAFRPLTYPRRTQSQDIAEHFKKLLDTKAPIERAPLDIPMLDEVEQ